jgi:hypothetical protein
MGSRLKLEKNIENDLNMYVRAFSVFDCFMTQSNN